MSQTENTPSEFVDLKVNLSDVPEPLTPLQLTWRRFRRHKMAMVGGGGTLLLIIFIIIGSIITPEAKANESLPTNRLAPPDSVHWFGTDSTGRDVFARIIYGGQISLVIGILAVTIAVTLGSFIGGVAAFYGGWLDALLMRFTESMLSIPSLFFIDCFRKISGTRCVDH